MTIRARTRLRGWPTLAAFCLIATVGLVGPASSAQAAAYPPAAGCAASYLPGDGVGERAGGTVTGTGFAAGAHVSLRIGGATLGSATASPRGDFSTQITLAETSSAISAVSDGCTVVEVDRPRGATPQTRVSATTQHQTASQGPLASTGAKIATPLALVVLLIAVGAVLARVARRRTG